MPLHKDLTGADLHEPKGVSSASTGTVYVSNGSGSGSWVKVPASSIDNTSVRNLNREQIFMSFLDIGTAGSRYQPIARNCKIVQILVSPQSATAGAATVLTFRNDAGTSMGTITVPNGASAGSVQSLSPVSNNTFVAGTKFQIDSDGGTSTNSNAVFTLELEWT